MNRITLIIFALLASATTAPAQAPRIEVYFDSGLTLAAADCPPAGTPHFTEIQTIYFVARDFNAWLSAIEFKVNYPDVLYWLGDNVDIGSRTALSIGNTSEGIAIAWPTPVNGFSPVLVCTAVTLWACDGCVGLSVAADGSPLGCAGSSTYVCLDVHPMTQQLSAIRWPDEYRIHAGGKGAFICPLLCGQTEIICPDFPSPAEATTWGSIKALYLE